MTLPQVLSKQARLARDQACWSLRRRCWTQERIAAELGIDQGTVSRILSRLEGRVFKQLARKVERVKARQTEQLEYIVAEAMSEWERSKCDALRLHTVERSVAGGEAVQRTSDETIAGRIGDAALLEQARGALADVRKIWGLDAPTKVETDALHDVKLYAVTNSPENL